MIYKFCVLITVCAAIFFRADIGHAVNESMDVVLVMDSSGSMKKTDPLSLRIPAAKLFISLLKERDRAGVISFSDKAYPIIHLTPANNAENKDPLFNAAEKITSDELYTNLHDELSKGFESLSQDNKTERARIIVLMSDGMMDVGDPDMDAELINTIRDELSVLLEESGVKVFTIAFTRQSDTLLLEKISKRTGGFYNLALKDKDFHLIFTSIFESLKSPEMLPISNNGFLVDGSVEEVTIVATKDEPDTFIKLNSPDGHAYSSTSKKNAIEWFVSNKFDMITVTEPVEGRWEILFSTGKNNKAYIITNLKLISNFNKLYSTFGEPMDVKIWLEKDGSPLIEQEILNKIELYIELTDPEGKTTRLKPFSTGDGTYARRIAPFTAGNYKMRIVAQGKTFQREKIFVFNIANSQESKEDVKAAWSKKKKLEQNSVKENPRVEENTAEMSWTSVLSKFALINLIVGSIIFVYIKRKNLNNINMSKLRKLKTSQLRKAPKEEETGKVEGPEEEDKNIADPGEENKEKEAGETGEAEQAKEVALETVEEPPADKLVSEDTGTDAQEQKEEDKQKNKIAERKQENESKHEVRLDDVEQGEDTSEADDMNEKAEIMPEENNEESAEPVIEAQEQSAEGKGKTEIEPEKHQEEDEKEIEAVPENEEDKEEAVAASVEDNQEPAKTRTENPETTEEKQENDEDGVLSQDALDSILAGAQDTETAEEEPVEAQAADETGEEINVDEMWAEAFKEAEGSKTDAGENKAEQEAPQKASEKMVEKPETEPKEQEEIQTADETDEEMKVDEMWAEAFKEAEAEQAIPQASHDEIKRGSEVAPGAQHQKDKKAVKPVPDNALENNGEDYNDKN
jgi:hypothetical protein